MKLTQLKLLSTLPDGYDYDFIRVNNRDVIIGKKYQEIIAYYLLENALDPITFKMNESNIEKRKGKQ